MCPSINTVKENNVRLQVCIILAIAAATAGCASSDKRVSRAGPTPPPEHGLQIRIVADNVMLASEVSDEGDFDEFDLLDEEAAQMVEISDPLQPVNRAMFWFNDKLYYGVIRPVCWVYKGVAPTPVRIGIRNFFHNILTPVRFVNCLLQGKKAAAGKELHRFAINTTEGVLGFGDPARDKHGLEPAGEGLGQTLAKYGVGDGVYIVWPLLGPSTVRDSVGMVGDQFLNPVRYIDHRRTSISVSATRIINERSLSIGDYESFKASAIDPYIALREAYIQYRKEQIEE